MGKLTLCGVTPNMTAPVGDITLADIAEGSIVKLNENGTPVEFYVACHNYESALNGTGRTLLVRKDCYGEHAWNSSYNNAYATSAIDTFLNGSYKTVLDEAVQAAIDTTKFYYTIGQGDYAVSELSRSVFSLSVSEFGLTSGHANVEGSALPIASTLRAANYNGSTVKQWTRSPHTSDTYYALCIAAGGGSANSDYNVLNALGVRPAFTFPSAAKFDPDTLLFKGA